MFSAQLIEHLIPILQILRFASSHEFTLKKLIFLLCCKSIVYEWGLNPHVWSTQISTKACRADGEVLRSKVWILVVTESKIGRSEVWTLMKVDQNFYFDTFNVTVIFYRGRHIFFLSSAGRAFDTDIAKSEVWIPTWVPEVSPSTLPYEHFVAILNKMRFESLQRLTQISSSAQLLEQMANY